MPSNMPNEDEIIKPVSDLLKMNFFIPSYQRGYRWTKRQVTDLLDDIRDFKPRENENEWYCLQPLVVKERNKENNEWEVIDGQQRLTTIFLIIHYLNEVVFGKGKKSEPTIKYQTRDTASDNSSKFLKNIKIEDDKDVTINDDNIDYHYISSAYKAINDWTKKNEDKFNDLEFPKKFIYNTKVIWYETGKNQDGRDIFSRINKGKIPLTNAELIKALFLNSSNFETTDKEIIRLKQLEIATEWDIMEAELYNDEFWLFINKEENNKETRIEYLFELIIGESDGEEDNYYTFRKFKEEFTDNTIKTIEESWKKIKRCFQTLKDWFENRELYHKIGFLITFGEDIKILKDLSQTETKSKFLDTINDNIKNMFKEIQIDEIEYNKNNSYDNIKKILLMHNIQTMLNIEKENSRFPFNRYKRQEWDIEHIHAIATKMPKTEQERIDWLKQTKLFIDEDKTDLIERMDNYSEETFDKLTMEILDYFNNKDKHKDKDKHEDIHDLSNLVLLDIGTNRGYKNAIFPIKRETIIDNEKKGIFIPPCTKNVFMKYYSDKIEQTTLWGVQDRERYKNNIKEVLSKYLPQENGQ